ncbi:MAG: glycosyltransferase family 39 protein [Candidatus Tyrphobacter sp.]
MGAWNHPSVDADGFLYTQMMLADAGMGASTAHRMASKHYLSLHRVRSDPRLAELFGARPPRYFTAELKLFRARILVPLLGAKLYPILGFRAMPMLSAFCILIAAILLYELFLLVSPPWIAAFGSMLVLMWPTVGAVATASGTDAPALAEWLLCLYATVRYARKSNPSWLALSLLSAALLGITRPAVWLPVAAACGLMLYARSKDSRLQHGARLMLVGQLIAAVGAVAFTYLVHGAGFIEQVDWQYQYHVAGHGHWVQYGPIIWYLAYVARAFTWYPLQLVATVVAPLALTAGALGLWRIRATAIAYVCASAAFIVPLAMVLNPQDPSRSVELPLAPIVMLGVCALVSSVLGAGPFARRGVNHT